jgi:hypothetical protein
MEIALPELIPLARARSVHLILTKKVEFIPPVTEY